VQCPNCFSDTTATLPRCARCNAPLPRQPSEQVERTDAQPPWDTPPRYPEQEGAGHIVAEPRSGVPRGGRALVIVAIALAVVGSGLVVGVVFWARGDDSPASAPISAPPSTDVTASSEPGPAAHDQAVAIDGLLEEMASSRTKLGGAVADASRCDGLTAAVDALGQVRDERQEQLNKARALAVDALDEGVELRNALARAADYSLRADEEFLAWAEANEGCTGTNTPKDGHFDRGEQISIDQAAPAKQEFADLWNPVAEQEGLSSRSGDDF
jgi:hypothetical protein